MQENELGQEKQLKLTVDGIVGLMESDKNLNRSIGFNAMRNNISVIGPLPWDDSLSTQHSWRDIDDAQFYAYCQTNYDAKSREDVRCALQVFADAHRYDPFLNLIESFKWDGIPRLGTLLHDYLGAKDDDYTRAVESLMFFAVLERSYSPGAKFDIAPVLIGPQGCGKSTFARMLALRDDFFTDDLKGITTKEGAEIILGKIVVEMSELASLRGRDVETIKSFLSRSFDTFRCAYGRRAEDHYRRCIFIGTTNSIQFLFDPTGNRRFLPVPCSVSTPTKDLFNNAASCDFVQAWAEALFHYRKGESFLILPKKFDEHVAALLEQATIEDPLIAPMKAFLDQEPLGSRVCVAQITQAIFDEKAKVNRSKMNDVRVLLQSPYFSEWQLLPGKHRVAGYVPQQAYEKISS